MLFVSIKLFYEDSIALKPKPDKDITRNYIPISLMKIPQKSLTKCGKLNPFIYEKDHT